MDVNIFCLSDRLYIASDPLTPDHTSIQETLIRSVTEMVKILSVYLRISDGSFGQ